MADTEQTALTKANNATQEISIESAESDIKSMIYVIRNQQVMIDSDLAMLYQVETRVLNQAVKRNISRFPERFRFQLTKEEYEILKSQIATSSIYKFIIFSIISISSILFIAKHFLPKSFIDAPK